MKKQISAAAVVTAMLVGAGAANAQSGTGSAGLSATVGALCDVLVSTNTNFAAYDVYDVLDGGSITFDISIACNDVDGAALVVSSNNGGLRLDDDGTSIPYEVVVREDDGGSTIITYIAEAPNTSASTVIPTSEDLRAFSGIPLKVDLNNIDGPFTGFAGTYSDTVTFSVSAPT